MSKPRILIWMTSMHIGGAERALIGLLHAFDYGRVQVDLFLNRHEGELMADIPPDINLLPENPKYKSLAEPIQLTVKRGQIAIAAARLLGKLAARRKENGVHRDSGISGEYSHKYTKWLMPNVNPDVEYDLAISFITPHYFVAEKVRAKKRIAWIHTDYSQIALDVSSQLKMWSAYDYIASISDEVTRAFLSVFPTLKDRIILIENILPEKLIRKQANEHDPDCTRAKYNLLTIGRFSYPKRLEDIPAICSALVSKGLDVCWNIIGYGDTEKMIKENIVKYQMEGHVHILGKKDNPYPYIKACDLYVQPSRYEGKAVTVREAQMLGRPVVITDFPTAHSQLEDGVDGIIVPMDMQACANAIVNLLTHPENMKALSENCKRREYSNKGEVQKLYELIGVE